MIILIGTNGGVHSLSEVPLSGNHSSQAGASSPSPPAGAFFSPATSCSSTVVWIAFYRILHVSVYRDPDFHLPGNLIFEKLSL
jgi:hypothetical protein